MTKNQSSFVIFDSMSFCFFFISNFPGKGPPDGIQIDVVDQKSVLCTELSAADLLGQVSSGGDGHLSTGIAIPCFLFWFFQFSEGGIGSILL